MIRPAHVEAVLRIDTSRLDLTAERQRQLQGLHRPLIVVLTLAASIVGFAFGVFGLDLVAAAFGERSIDLFAVRWVMNTAAIIIVGAPLAAAGLSTGAARAARDELVDWLLEQEIAAARAYIRQVEGDEGLVWRFAPPGAVRPSVDREDAARRLQERLGTDERLQRVTAHSRAGRVDLIDPDGYRAAIEVVQGAYEGRSAPREST